MLSLGLSTTKYAQYVQTLATSHEVAITVQILSPEHEVLRTVSNTLIDGQIDVTTPKISGDDVEVSRTAQLTLVDPDQSLALDSGSPADGAFYMDRMVRIIYSVLCPFGWVDVPVFTGPVIKVDRDGDVIDVECQGKEYYALGSAWNSGTEKGRKGDVMTALMRRSGETSRYLNFPDTKATVGKGLSVGRESKYWAKVWRVNSSMNRILFYDGRGVAQSRKRPTKSAIVLKTGPGGTIVKPPQISYSNEDMKNAWRVTGAKPSKGKHSVYATATPPKAHKLSPWSLGRRDKPLYLAGFETNTDFKHTQACRRRALDLLADSLLQHVETPLEVIPIPHLEPWDVVTVQTDKFSTRVRASQFTLPLVQRSGDGVAMTIGTRRDVRKPSRRIGRS